MVVHARHEVMGRDVALKFLKPKVVDTNPEVSERFVKEVQIASRLNHPNVVAIYDFGVTDDGIYYMVQEFVDGLTVDALLPPGRPLQQDRVLRMVHQVLDCLCEAHEQGVIHRDLKPSNLMSTTGEDGEEVIKILDFGVAKLLESDSSSPASQLRQSTKFIGTPIYMSPEQILGREVSPSSDLYSVGLMCYEMLTGQPPIQAEQIAEVVQQHLSDAPFDFPMLHLLESHLQRIILKATSREVSERYESAEDFMAAFDQDSLEEFSQTSMLDPALSDFDSGDTRVSPSPEHELDAFLGKNYIGLEESSGESFQPLSQAQQREQRAPTSPSAFSMDDLFGAIPASELPAPMADQARSRDGIPFDAVSKPMPPPERSVSSTLSGEYRRPPQDPAPSSSGIHRVNPEKKPPVTASQRLELDMDAMRSVRKDRNRAVTDDRQRTRQEFQLDEVDRSGSALWGGVLVFLGCIAFFITLVMLCAVSDGMPGPVRLFVGVLPLLISIGMVAFQSSSRDGIMDRWLEPVALRVLVMLAVSFVMVAMFSNHAAIALRHEGDWLFTSLPNAEPFVTMGAMSQSLANGLAGLFEVFAKIIPW